MAKPKTPNQKRKYGELNKRLAKYVMLVESIYEDLNLEAAKIVGILPLIVIGRLCGRIIPKQGNG